MSVVAACVVPLIWPGDAAFINDEPKLIAIALDANANHALATTGLPGTFGFVYGPAPVWIYQVLVAVTHNLVLIAWLHTLLMVAATAAALWWLSSSLRLWMWFLPVPLLSPYFWFYARVLWDNPLLMPIGALSLAGYAAYLDTGSAAGLRVSLCAMVLAPLVHLMSVAFILPLAAHMFIVRWRALRAHWLSVAAVALVAVSVAWPYWNYLFSHGVPSLDQSSRIEGWLFPLQGARLLTAAQLDYFFGRDPVSGPGMAIVVGISRLAYVLAWTGMGIIVFRIVTAIRTKRWTTCDHVAVIMLGSLACQILLDGLSSKFEHPQYQNATWITAVLLAWFSIDRVSKLRSPLRWSAHVATGLQAAALGLTVGTVALRLHESRGTRAIYGPTIADQQDVARKLARYSPRSRVDSRIIHYELFPHTLDVLRRLNARRFYERPTGFLEIHYASDDPRSGAIALSER